MHARAQHIDGEDCQSIRASRPGIRQLGVVTFPEQSPHHPAVPLHPLPPFPSPRLVNEPPPDPANAICQWTGNEARPDLSLERERRRAAIGRAQLPGHAHRAGVRLGDVVWLERPALAEDRTRYRFHGSRGGGAPRRQAPRRRPPPRGERTAWPQPSW